jgi:hypothetical protein
LHATHSITPVTDYLIIYRNKNVKIKVIPSAIDSEMLLLSAVYIVKNERGKGLLSSEM